MRDNSLMLEEVPLLEKTSIFETNRNLFLLACIGQTKETMMPQVILPFKLFA